MSKLTPNQANVLSALRLMITRKRPWLPLATLDSYDGRTVNALIDRGLIEVNFDYGVRLPAREILDT